LGPKVKAVITFWKNDYFSKTKPEKGKRIKGRELWGYLL
jgi:hypothetical protein